MDEIVEFIGEGAIAVIFYRNKLFRLYTDTGNKYIRVNYE